MSVKVEALEKSMAKLTIEASAEEFEAAVEKAYQKNKNKINVQGFRKGKAPRKVIEKMYGTGVFYEDAANIVIPEAYAQAAEESGLEIVSRPEISVEQIEAGKPFVFSATVAVKPEVKLGQYKGVEVEKASAEASEEDINAELQKVQEQNSRMIDVDDRAVEQGDTVTLDFEGFVDGEAFEGGKGEDYELVIGSGSFIPGFEDQLVGAELNVEKEVNVTFPEEYHAKELAGKPAVFKCTVKAVKVKELPVLDDEFASDVSDYDTLEEYKESLKKDILKKKEEAAKTAKENEAVDKAVENAEMELPEAMVQTQAENMVEDFAQRIQGQGLTMEQYMQYTGLTPDRMAEQMKPQAVKRIQTRLVLEEIVKAENIQVSDEEVEAELQKMAEMYKMELDKLKEYMGEEEKESMKKDLAVQKAVDLLVENAIEVETKKEEESKEAE
ncbi:trigger factor [Cuneatibacter caecimuris]|uniref:Trigger factor n=1 Tax=Cuneatibacter caecimuris TaxID=1796618 RepID=A0A4Q7PJ80_9FIRM|nr:trigger factor [Cuneatibacter caecimuris]RZT00667.1 trigger factor [Cuneatibacter caecimuris]